MIVKFSGSDSGPKNNQLRVEHQLNIKFILASSVVTFKLTAGPSPMLLAAVR